MFPLIFQLSFTARHTSSKVHEEVVKNACNVMVFLITVKCAAELNRIDSSKGHVAEGM